MKYLLLITVDGVRRTSQVTNVPLPLPAWAATPEAFLEKLLAHPGEWKRAPDDLPDQSGYIFTGGATDDIAQYKKPDGTAINPGPVVPQPNTPGNPFFGKTPLTVADFYALIGQALAPKRYKRLVTDAAFLWVKDVIDSSKTIDPDDKAGRFLQITGDKGYLLNTAGDDGAVLMEKAERDAIMKAWK